VDLLGVAISLKNKPKKDFLIEIEVMPAPSIEEPELDKIESAYDKANRQIVFFNEGVSRIQQTLDQLIKMNKRLADENWSLKEKIKKEPGKCGRDKDVERVVESMARKIIRSIRDHLLYGQEAQKKEKKKR